MEEELIYILNDGSEVPVNKNDQQYFEDHNPQAKLKQSTPPNEAPKINEPGKQKGSTDGVDVDVEQSPETNLSQKNQQQQEEDTESESEDGSSVWSSLTNVASAFLPKKYKIVNDDGNEEYIDVNSKEEELNLLEKNKDKNVIAQQDWNKPKEDLSETFGFTYTLSDGSEATVSKADKEHFEQENPQAKLKHSNVSSDEFINSTPNEILTYANGGADWFNNNKTWHEDPKRNADIQSKVAKGTHGYNPRTKKLIKLKEPIEVAKTDQMLVESIRGGFSIEEHDRWDIWKDDFKNKKIKSTLPELDSSILSLTEDEAAAKITEMYGDWGIIVKEIYPGLNYVELESTTTGETFKMPVNYKTKDKDYGKYGDIAKPIYQINQGISQLVGFDSADTRATNKANEAMVWLNSHIDPLGGKGDHMKYIDKHIGVTEEQSKEIIKDTNDKTVNITNFKKQLGMETASDSEAYKAFAAVWNARMRKKAGVSLTGQQSYYESLKGGMGVLALVDVTGVGPSSLSDENIMKLVEQVDKDPKLAATLSKLYDNWDSDFVKDWAKNENEYLFNDAKQKYIEEVFDGDEEAFYKEYMDSSGPSGWSHGDPLLLIGEGEVKKNTGYWTQYLDHWTDVKTGEKITTEEAVEKGYLQEVPVWGDDTRTEVMPHANTYDYITNKLYRKDVKQLHDDPKFKNILDNLDAETRKDAKSEQIDDLIHTEEVEKYDKNLRNFIKDNSDNLWSMSKMQEMYAKYAEAEQYDISEELKHTTSKVNFKHKKIEENVEDAFNLQKDLEGYTTGIKELQNSDHGILSNDDLEIKVAEYKSDVMSEDDYNKGIENIKSKYVIPNNKEIEDFRSDLEGKVERGELDANKANNTWDKYVADITSKEKEGNKELTEYYNDYKEKIDLANKNIEELYSDQQEKVNIFNDKVTELESGYSDQLEEYNTIMDSMPSLQKSLSEDLEEMDELGDYNERLLLSVDALQRNHEPIRTFTVGAAASTLDLVRTLTLDLADALINIPIELGLDIGDTLEGASNFIQNRSEGWQEFTSLMRGTIKKPMQFDNIEGVSDFFDWGGTMTSEQLPLLATMMMTGNMALPLMGTYSGASKWRELEQFERLHGVDIPALRMYINSIGSGTAEAVFERVTFGQLKAFKTAFRGTKGQLGFKNAIKRKYTAKDYAISTGKHMLDPISEGGSEVLAGAASRWFDKYLTGTYDGSIWDGALEEFISGKTISISLKTPTLAKAFVEPFRAPDENQKMAENSDQIIKLSQELSKEMPNFSKPRDPVDGPPSYKIDDKKVSKKEMMDYILSGKMDQKGATDVGVNLNVSNDNLMLDLIEATPEQRKKIAKIINLANENTDLLENQIKRVDVLTPEEKSELIDLNKQDYAARQAADEIMADDAMTELEKTGAMETLQQDVIAREKQRNDIIKKYPNDLVQEEYLKQRNSVIQKTAEMAKEYGAPDFQVDNLSDAEFKQEIARYDIKKDKDILKAEDIAAEKEATVEALNNIIKDKDATPEEKAEAKELKKNPEAIVNMLGNILNNDSYGVMQPKFDKKGNLSNIKILVNKKTALEDGKLNTVSHEFIHAAFYNTLKADPIAREQLGREVIDILNSDGVTFSSPAKAREFNKRVQQYDANNNGEEIMAIASEMMIDGDIKFKDGPVQKMKNVFRRFTGAMMNRDIKFDNNNDVKNFMRDYHHSITNNKPSPAIARMLAKGANGKIFKETRTPEQIKGEQMYSKTVQEESKEAEARKDKGSRSMIDKYTLNKDNSKKYKTAEEFQDSPAVWDAYKDLQDSKFIKNIILQGTSSLGITNINEVNDYYRKVIDKVLNEKFKSGYTKNYRKLKDQILEKRKNKEITAKETVELMSKLESGIHPFNNNKTQIRTRGFDATDGTGSIFGYITGIAIPKSKLNVQKEYIQKEFGGLKISTEARINEGQTIGDRIADQKSDFMTRLNEVDMSHAARKINKDIVEDLIMVMDLFGLPGKVRKAVTNNIKETYIPLDIITDPNAKFSTYKNIKKLLVEKEFDPKVLNPKTGKQSKSEKAVIPTGPLFGVLNAIAAEIGVDPLRILANQNLDDNQRKLSQKWIFDKAVNEDGTLNNNAVKALPDGADRSGRATGLSKKLLEAFYIKGGRAEFAGGATAAGLATQTKRTNITKEEFLDTFGINPDGSLQPGTDADGAINQYVVQVATLAAIQEITVNTIENELAEAKIIARLSEGKGEQMFSEKMMNESFKEVDPIIKEYTDDFVQAELGGETFKGQNVRNALLREKGLPEYNWKVKDEKDIPRVINDVKHGILPLLPKDAYYGKGDHRKINPKTGKLYQVGSAFTVSSRNFGLKSTDPLWPKLRKKILDLKFDKTVKFGKPIPGLTKAEHKNMFSLRNFYEKVRENPEVFRSKLSEVKDFNRQAMAIHEALMMRINESIENSKGLSATPIMGYLGLASNDMGHYFKLGAEIVGFSTEINDYIDDNGNWKKARFEMEHAMVATQTYMYQMNAILARVVSKLPINFEATYDFVVKDFKVIALDKAVERNITKAGLQKKMQDTYNLATDRFYTRYTNIGIDFELIEMVSDGRTMGETYNINTDGDIRIAQEFSKRQSKQNVNDAFNNRIKNAIKGKTKGMSTFDFDDTLAKTKSGVRATAPNPDGTPKPKRKVIFLAGGAGSGKGNVTKKLNLEKQGFKIVNQDISLQWLKKNHGLPENMNELTKEQRSKLGKLDHQARGIARKKMMKYQGNADGVVVDGTGGSAKQMQKLVDEFKSKGYDVSMLFVDTSLDVALERNRARKERSLLDKIVRSNHQAVQGNKDTFKKMFDKRFMEINTDNLTQKDPMPSDLVNKVDDFVSGYEKLRLDATEFAEQGDAILQRGGKFDFSEFNDVVDGTPGPLLNKAKERAAKYGNKDMFILTARPQASAKAIHEFLKSQGLNIPIKNITGLANSSGNAKAEWMLQKFAEGYNDMYFVDDAWQNVDAVKKVLDQLDIKSKVVQAFSKRVQDSSKNFNDMLERKKGIAAEKVFSAAEARKRGNELKLGRFLKSLYIPPSAEDFKGLIYYFLGKGKQGEADLKFFADNLFKPFAKGIRAWNSYKQNMVNEYKALKKEFPNVRKELNKKVPDSAWTTDTAIRTYLWNKSGFDIPGMDQATIDELVNYVNINPDIKAFAEGLSIITKRKDGYVKPTDNWMVESIPSDLRNIVDKIGRKEFLDEWVNNKDIIFSPDNLNKIEALYGNSFREALENILYRMEHGNNRTYGKDKVVGKFTNWINGSVGAIMFFNMRSALLQTISTVNFINWGDNNMFKASAAFANQPQFWKDFAMLFNSDQLKQRRKGLQTDVSASELQKTFAEKGYSPGTVINYLLQIGFTPTQVADSFAIAFGGASFYRNRYKKYTKEGMPNKEAHEKTMLEFQEIAEETQQSSREDLVSQQQASPLGRIILAFQNVTMQYGRLTKKALSDLVNGRGDTKTNISKIIYYGVAQNIVFAALQSALAMIMWGDDEEEIEKRTTRTANQALDSFLRGTGLYGALISTLKNTAIQWHLQSQKGYGQQRTEKIALELINLSPPIGSKIRKIINAFNTEMYNKGVSEELGWRIENPRLSMAANIIEAIFNIPLARIINKANNLEEAITGQHEIWQRIAMLLGWNRWDVGVEDEELEEAKQRVKDKKKIEKEKEKEIKKLEEKKEKEEEKEKEEKEKKEKGIKTIRCSGVNSSGNRCGNTTETASKTWKCPHHSTFVEGSDRDGDGKPEYRCIATKSNGKRCKNKTENKSKKCYAHQ